jgi:hypothetical protein
MYVLCGIVAREYAYHHRHAKLDVAQHLAAQAWKSVKLETHAVEVDGARPLVGEQRHNIYPISDLHSTQEQQQQERCRQRQSIK